MTTCQRLSKEKGELAELAFLYRAAQFGFVVSKPYGDSAKYDFIVDGWGRVSRAQVKSCSTMRDGRAYAFNTYRRTRGRPVPYYPGEIDVFIGYVEPEDAFYIIPVRKCALKKCLRVYPHAPQKDHLYGRFRENWACLGLPESGPRRQQLRAAIRARRGADFAGGDPRLAAHATRCSLRGAVVLAGRCHLRSRQR